MAEQEKSIQQLQIENIARVISTPRINEDDKNILRSVFAGRVELIIALRNVLFGEASDQDKYMVAEGLNSDKAKAVVRKILLPRIEPDNPFKQSIDLWQTFDIQGEDDDRVAKLVKGRKKLIEMLEQGLALIEKDIKGEAPDLDLDNKPLKEITFDVLTARNTYISHVENQMVGIATMSASTGMTPEEIADKRKKDSVK